MGILRRIATAGAALVVSGCATIFSNGPSTVRVESDPSGARVTAQNGEVWGTTPFTRTEKPRNGAVLMFSRESYDAATMPLNRTIKPIAFLNLLNVLAWGIDFATGSLWKYDETTLRANLSRRTSLLTPAERQDLACSAYAAIWAAGAEQTFTERATRAAAVREVLEVPITACAAGS